MMKLRGEGRQWIGCVLGQRACPVERHLPGASMTVPQTAQVRCETLE
jgi:hypothetical protein